ncbi:NCS1 family nucleobase:cation symporter-1 [Brevibacterium sanguinis]|uniref:NCS1 family nucleobase:cation symporter-1 n=2 Tax=Brevibacterium TaxID=1696 RepID=A0A366IR88_9MICO|nr:MULTISPECIES: cytosine permease [Brevibacterium]RBP67797.1 NCS1 family nucleobase:cation symporter-1 [Brevibacterium sanguinis]RBP74786.1 NCS1 family nucleobase:cation symporter-1 [Brevibacterium celere]
MKVEDKSITHIPAEERYGKPSKLFFTWFGSNMQLTPMVTGALGVVLGLSLPWTLIAIVVGNLIGGVFMATHSAQGPKLGIPQMIQSRAQFGVIGAIFPLLLVILMYTGFFGMTSVLGGEALAELGVGNQNLAIIIINIVMLVLAIYGYRLIHRVEKALSVIFFVFYLVLTIVVLSRTLPEGAFTFGIPNVPVFMLCVGIYASWLLAFAPYVADYSRYLPEATRPSRTFWATYLGSNAAVIWMMCLGAYLAVLIPGFDQSSSASLAGVLGTDPAPLVYLIIVLGIIGANVFNLYGAFLSIVTTLEPFTTIRGTIRTKVIITSSVCLVGTLLGIFAHGDFLANFSSFLGILLNFMIPWTAINLVDFYFIKKGQYDVAELFKVNGRYRAVNWSTILVFVLSVIVQIPFISAAYYTGPIAEALGGVDLAWVVGIVVPATLYFLANRKHAIDASLKDAGNRPIDEIDDLQGAR